MFQRARSSVNTHETCLTIIDEKTTLGSSRTGFPGASIAQAIDVLLLCVCLTPRRARHNMELIDNDDAPEEKRKYEGYPIGWYCYGMGGYRPCKWYGIWYGDAYKPSSNLSLI